MTAGHLIGMTITVPTCKPQFYAIGLRGWVEIRRHTRHPQEITSSAKVKVKYDHFEPWDVWEECPIGWNKVITLKQTHWVGGRIIRTLKANKFKYRAGFSVGPNKCVRLTKRTMEKVTWLKQLKSKNV